MQFGLIEMWHAMGVLVKTVAILLMFLSSLSIYYFIERNLVFARAKSKSKKLAPKLANLMKEQKLQDALTLSSKKEYRGSHLARITSAGIQEFFEGQTHGLKFEEQLETASRGMDRASTIFTQDLKKGLSTLATIATSSPFIGLFGTIFGIINSFRGMAMTGSGGIGAVAGGIAEALVATAFGIGVAIIALWCYNFLNNKVEIYGAEMSNTSSEVIDFFIRQHK